MRPIPTSFHIGPLEIHTYGIGLAITFWFAYATSRSRLARPGLSDRLGLDACSSGSSRPPSSAPEPCTCSPTWATTASHPGQIVAIWQGGLSSFGGLILAVPVAIVVVRKRCPDLGVLNGLDIVMPVLLAAWALGRLLGPQLMVPEAAAIRRASGSACTTTARSAGAFPCRSSRQSRTSPST